MKIGFLFQQSMWGWGQLERGLEEGGVVLYETPRDVTVTLVHAEDLTSVSRILSTVVPVVNGSMIRKVTHVRNHP
jgi:hypothetical protein